MTEKDVEALVVEVGKVDWSDPSVVVWIEEGLATARTDEKRFKAAFTFHKMLRNDDQMQITVEGLRRTRESIKTLEILLEKRNE